MSEYYTPAELLQMFYTYKPILNTTYKARAERTIVRALHKQTPMSPVCMCNSTTIRCSACNNVIVFGVKYCENCGQAVDWT